MVCQFHRENVRLLDNACEALSIWPVLSSPTFFAIQTASWWRTQDRSFFTSSKYILLPASEYLPVLFPLLIPLSFLLCTEILPSYSSGNSLTSLPVLFLVFQFSFKALITVTLTYISMFICLMSVFSTKLQALEWQGFFQSCLPLFLGLLAKGIEFRIGSINICWMSEWMMNEETLYSLWSLHSPCQLQSPGFLSLVESLWCVSDHLISPKPYIQWFAKEHSRFLSDIL